MNKIKTWFKKWFKYHQTRRALKNNYHIYSSRKVSVVFLNEPNADKYIMETVLDMFFKAQEEFNLPLRFNYSIGDCGYDFIENLKTITVRMHYKVKL